MQNFETILILVGTCLPLIGTGLTVLFASITSGILRWAVLALLPLITLIACRLIIDMVWADGNMLAAALYLVFLVALFIYYPVLTVSGLIIYRNIKNTNQS